MISEANEAVSAARRVLESEYGSDLITEEGYVIVIREDLVSDRGPAWLVPFNTREYLETNDPMTSVLPSVLLVPKDPTVPVHAPPSAFDVDTYLRMVTKGDLPWPT